MSGLFQNIITGTASTATFTSTETTNGGCVVNYRALVVAQNGGNALLISLPNPATPTLAFAASTFLTDVGAYSVTVEAGYGANFALSASTILASATTTYTYFNPCSTATFTSPWGDFLAGKSYMTTVLGPLVTNTNSPAASSIGTDSVSYYM